MAGAYRNPIGKGAGSGRIDMGVDYTGVFDLYALGDGVIGNVFNSGWPGGTFITLNLDGENRAVYYAENIAPAVTVGQHVTAGQLVGRARGASPWTEIGWAPKGSTGNTMAQVSGQNAAGLAHGDPGAYSTAYGVNFSNLVKSLGGPPGVTVPPIQGSVPAAWGSGTPTPGTVNTASAGDLIAAIVTGAAIPAGMVLVLFAVAVVAAAAATAAAVGGAAYIASRG